MNPTRESKRRLLLKCGAAFFALMLLMSTFLLVISWWDNAGSGSGFFGRDDEEIVYRGRRYALKEGITTLLVMGLDTFDNADSGSYRNHKQADFLALLVLDNHEKNCRVIQLNRDTMVEMDVLGVGGDKIDTTVAQLALAHTYGDGRETSCRNTANAVANLLGVDVSGYISVSMDAVPRYNDLLGGVAVEVMDDLTAIDPALVKGELVTLLGDQALDYVRSRKGLDDPTNERRMQRQKQYVQAVLDATAAKDEAFLLSAVTALEPYWVSNRTETDLANMVSRYRINTPRAIYTIEGTSTVGEEFMEFVPDPEALQEIVIDCFYTPVA